LVLFWTGYVGEVHLPLAEQGPLGKAQLRTNSQWTINSSRMVTLDNRNDEYLLLIMALQPFSGSIVAFYQWHWLNVDGYIYSFHLGVRYNFLHFENLCFTILLTWACLRAHADTQPPIHQNGVEHNCWTPDKCWLWSDKISCF
jgi:hypothetical protein